MRVDSSLWRLSVGIFLHGCALAFPADQVQCETNADCASDLCAAGLCRNLDELGRWGCAGVLSPFPGPPGLTADAEIVVSNGLIPVPGATLAVCELRDESCDSPVSGPRVVDGRGEAVLSIPWGRSAYIEAFGAEGSWPTMTVLSDTTLLPRRLAVVSSPSAGPNSLQARFQVAPQPDRGFLILATRTCISRQEEAVDRSGVEVFVEGAEQVTYLDASLSPDFSRKTTSFDGVSIATDVEPGFRRVRSFVDQELVSDTRVPVRAGWVTRVDLFPRRRSAP